MKQFITKYAHIIKGVLSGFDRLVFRGSMSSFNFDAGRKFYLCLEKLPYKDFVAHAQKVTERVKIASLAPIQAEGRPVVYLASSKISKEETAKRIATENQITEGNICVLTAVEPCMGLDIIGNKETHRLEIVSRPRKCLHYYHYWYHPVFGFMNARIQTYFPFTIQICMNGREWLSRQMDAADMGYQRADNCFTWVEDYEKAQAFLQQQLKADWVSLLDEVALRLNPLHNELFGNFSPQYYWTCFQSEWATDVVFDNNETLQRMYPSFIQHGITTFRSPDVMRFLGKKIPLSNKFPARFNGEVSSDVKTRHEGVRIKHKSDGNSVKMYDKAATEKAAVLRIETTIQHPEVFKALRPKQGGDPDDLAVRPLRKGLNDLSRRADAGNACNERYLDAQANANTEERLGELLSKIVQPATYNEKRVRALRPFDAEDTKLLECHFSPHTVPGVFTQSVPGVFTQSVPLLGDSDGNPLIPFQLVE